MIQISAKGYSLKDLIYVHEIKILQPNSKETKLFIVYR